MKLTTTLLRFFLIGSMISIAETSEVKGPGGYGSISMMQQRLTVVIDQTETQQQEVAVAKPGTLHLSFRYGGENGKAHPLKNHTTLVSGDKFSLVAEIKEPLCFYLFHFDSKRQPTELVSSNGYPNCFQGEQRLAIPAKHPDGTEQHFKLDNTVGLEQFHIIVSPQPNDALFALYNRSRGADSQQHALMLTQVEQTKGFETEKDIVPAEQRKVRMLSCQEVQGCRESFQIEHK